MERASRSAEGVLLFSVGTVTGEGGSEAHIVSLNSM